MTNDSVPSAQTPSFVRNLNSNAVHLAIIRFVIVAGEMEQSVKNQLRDFVLKRQTVFLRLRRCRFH